MLLLRRYTLGCGYVDVFVHIYGVHCCLQLAACIMQEGQVAQLGWSQDTFMTTSLVHAVGHETNCCIIVDIGQQKQMDYHYSRMINNG